MDRSDATSARRPLKSRASAWAGWLSGVLVRSGISANSISVCSVVFSLAAGAVLLCVGQGLLNTWGFLAAAVLIQLRLICNLMDGMVAIEGGKKSAVGDLYNEVPDRIADVAILGGFGFCAIGQPWGMHLGWLAASLAVMTAYVRMQGASLTGKHDFRGPMAKPQRMALVTGTCVVAAFLPAAIDWVFWALTLMIMGEVATLYRRLAGISAILRGEGEP
ncbi:MAG: CDP-alcohol phosphatidyltransferase family protein [Luteolibacter sp.]